MREPTKIPGSTRRKDLERRLVAASLCICLVIGAVAAGGQATLALLTAGLLVGSLVVVGQRRFMVLALWGAVAFFAPLNGVRVSLLVAVSDVFLVAAVLTSLPDVLRRSHRRRSVVPTTLAIAFGTIIVAGLVGTFFAEDVAASLTNMIKVVLAAAGSVLALALWNPGSRRLRQFAWLWFAGAFTSVAVAIATRRRVVGRALGLTTHPNHFGLVCLLAVGLGLGLAFSSSGRARQLTFAATGVLVVGVGISGSRSALLGLAVTLLVAAVLCRQVRLLVGTGVMVLLLGMAVIGGLVHLPASQAISRLGGGGGAAASDAERRQTLAVALTSINRHPLTGEGFESAQAAHSIYLQTLVVGGPVALGGFLWVCWTIGRLGILAARSGRGRGDHLVVGGLTAGFAGYVVSGTFDNILWDRYLWTYLGLLVVLAGTRRSEQRDPPEATAAPAAAATVRPDNLRSDDRSEEASVDGLGER